MLISLLLIFSGLSHASDDGWLEVRAQCAAEFRAEWGLEIEKGKAWAVSSAQNLDGLQRMGREICPNYLAKRNDANAIQSFVGAKAQILDRSPLEDKEGHRLNEFIRQQLLQHQLVFGPTGIDFLNNRCGSHLRAIHARIERRLMEIQREASTVAAKCIGANDARDAAAALQNQSIQSQKTQSQKENTPQGIDPKRSGISGAIDPQK